MKEAEWEKLPVLTSSDVAAFVHVVLSGSDPQAEQPQFAKLGTVKALPPEEVKDAVEIASVFLGMYETWELGFFEGSIPYEAFRNVLMVKDQKLNLTNDTWKRNRLMLEPIIANCTNACTTFESVCITNKTLSDDAIHVLYALRIRRFEFIAWLIFVLTGDTHAWTTSSLVMAKVGSSESFEAFKGRVLNRARQWGN